MNSIFRAKQKLTIQSIQYTMQKQKLTIYESNINIKRRLITRCKNDNIRLVRSYFSKFI